MAHGQGTWGWYLHVHGKDVRDVLGAAQGLPPIKIGGGGIYSDPEADAEEESLEVVQSFFDDANSASTAEWRQQQELLKRRRKDASASQSRNNW